MVLPVLFRARGASKSGRMEAFPLRQSHCVYLGTSRAPGPEGAAHRSHPTTRPQGWEASRLDGWHWRTCENGNAGKKGKEAGMLCPRWSSLADVLGKINGERALTTCVFHTPSA